MRRFLAIVVSAICCSLSTAHAVGLTILHTNDLHSNFQPSRHVTNLGGYARIKTVFDRAREERPNVLALDGGDFSEGQAYYNLDGGGTSFRMLTWMGIDATVIGNHDFINGPEQIIRNIDAAKVPGLRTTEFLAANLDFEAYANAEEFKRRVKPYIWREIGGKKIAIIGITTYEKIYDKYFAPVKIVNPQKTLETVLAEIGDQADMVIVLSHNRVSLNEKFLRKFPKIDLVIGAHDHRKLEKPIAVKRDHGRGKSWLVEAGHWGRYVGKIDTSVQKNKVHFRRYDLITVDRNILENEGIATIVTELDRQINEHYGEQIHDCIGESHVDLDRGFNEVEPGQSKYETLMGNLAVDAYRNHTGADLAVERIDFVYGELYKGKIRAVDVLNALPAVYNPETGRSWTLHTLMMKGSVVDWVFRTVLSTRGLRAYSYLHVSGGEVTYDGFFDIKSITIGGQPIDHERMYRVAFSGGTLEVLRFVDGLLPRSRINWANLVDTRTESWRVVANYIKKSSPITAATIPFGNRVRPLKHDLAVQAMDIDWIPAVSSTETPWLEAGVARIRVRNLGHRPSPTKGVWLRVANATALPLLVPAIDAGGEWTAELPLVLGGGLDFPVRKLSVTLDDEREDEFEDVYTQNNSATAYF